MDYTTLERTIKAFQSITGETSPQVPLLLRQITEASRAIDRHCTGVPDAVDYFKLEDVTGERLRAQIDYNGRIICYPHKPIINSVSSFTFQENPTKQVYTVDTSFVVAEGPQVEVYPRNLGLAYPARCWVTLSYNGGLGIISGSAMSGSGITLPDDLINLATLLAVRFYREEETGLTDAIGVPELATVMYTKAFPVRFERMAEPFRRKVGWRFVS